MKVYIVIYTVSSYNKNIGSEINQIYVLRGGQDVKHMLELRLSQII